MRMLTGISTRVAQLLIPPFPPLLPLPLLQPQVHPHPRVLPPAQAAPRLESFMMVLASWVPSVVRSVSPWIGRPSRSALRTISIWAYSSLNYGPSKIATVSRHIIKPLPVLIEHSRHRSQSLDRCCSFMAQGHKSDRIQRARPVSWQPYKRVKLSISYLHRPGQSWMTPSTAISGWVSLIHTDFVENFHKLIPRHSTTSPNTNPP